MATFASPTSASNSRQNPHFRKIELQSPADLHHLISQTRAAARKQIDAAFPPASNGSHQNKDGGNLTLIATSSGGGSNDRETNDVRRRVEEMVEEYVRQVFLSVRANITINGLDLPTTDSIQSSSSLSTDLENEMFPAEEEYELLDAKLAERLRAAEALKESLTEAVADLRRTAPVKIAEGYKKRMVEEDEAMEVEFEEDRVRSSAESSGQTKRSEEGGEAVDNENIADDEEKDKEEMQGILHTNRLKRGDEIAYSWAKATQELVALQSELPEVVGRLERAQEALEVVEEKEGKNRPR